MARWALPSTQASRLSIRSEIGFGTTVTLWLPAEVEGMNRR